MLTTRIHRVAMLSAGMVLLIASAGALAQPAAPAAPGAGAARSLRSLWEDFLHYIKIAQPGAALSHGQQIIASSPKASEIYKLSEAYPESLSVIARGMRLKGLKETCEKMRKLVEAGYRELQADTTEIARSIQMLGGTVRQYELGVKRLKISGEYALPQLLQKLAAKTTSGTLRTRIVIALPRLGTQICRGLSAALTAKDPALLEIVANTLGRLEDPIATARLKELSERAGLLTRPKEATVGALRVCGGAEAQKKTVSELFYNLALKYYYRAESLRPDRRYDTANVWYWKEDLGLTYTPVPRGIFCDVYAMRMARLALQYDEKYYPAVSLWLSAHIRKEVDLKGATDPIRGQEQPAAKYYALASPAVYLQHVLARAMRDKNSAVAIAAIKALGETAGAMNLVKEVQGGAMPLVEAMTYEDRQVRFLAAETLANATPKERFAGAEVVLWVLNEAIRQMGKKRALLIAADPTVRNSLKNALRGAGCEVIDEPDPVKALSAARAIGGVDVVALGIKPDPQTTVDLMRHDPSFAGVPVLMAAKGRAYRDLAARDKKMVVIDPAADPAAMKTALDAAAKLGGAPLSADEAAQWAVRAAKCVRMLGLTKTKVYEVDRARLALIDALGDSRDAVQIAAAQALAILPAADAQQAIVTLAVTGTKENVRVAAFKAASESVRTFGRQTTDDQAKAVLTVVMGKGSPALLNAAAQLLGAMNLPSEKIKEMILSTKGMD